MILVIQTAFLGDLLLSIPLLKRIRFNYPKSKIKLICRRGYGHFFKKVGLCDDFFEVTKDKAGLSDFLEQNQKTTFDMIIAPHKSVRTHFFIRRLKSPLKIGFKNFWNCLFFDQRIDFNKNWPDAIRQISLLKNQDLQLKENLESISQDICPFATVPDFFNMVLTIDESDKKNVIEKYQLKIGRVIGISPGSVWNTKRWTEIGFIDVINHFLKLNYQVVILGSSDEVDVCKKIFQKFSQSDVVNLAGKTDIFELAAIVSSLNLIFTNDNGSMHMASAMGTPNVAIFGPTTLDLGYQPWSKLAKVVQIDLDCRPCGKHGSQVCPLGTHDCMKKLESRLVISSGESLLR